MLLLSGGRTFSFSAKENVALQDPEGPISWSCTFARKQTTVIILSLFNELWQDLVPENLYLSGKGELSVVSCKLISSPTCWGVSNSRYADRVRVTRVPLLAVTAHWFRHCLVSPPALATTACPLACLLNVI